MRIIEELNQLVKKMKTINSAKDFIKLYFYYSKIIRFKKLSDYKQVWFELFPLLQNLPAEKQIVKLKQIERRLKQSK